MSEFFRRAILRWLFPPDYGRMSAHDINTHMREFLADMRPVK